ncbi:RsmF rRNA methyltransferase first C-terminal domain-containing protein [Paenibacillus sedimenti]|uniref:RsmF rRNA methyltransferase first C-terminal domain-containing protein n=1 Tax=Paenibacillus sedimenti TaxID=2770274 RepID=A0A926QK36_9BACL|nr:RsmF rRNA methyltransferase first C-terminal domain-containing protein [Paenibacillus sedimenti]MBD0381072.1 RsmF rRNA methyltransferase first C-terminal domain-containing protein [Paenibacillus sedimenti]
MTTVPLPPAYIERMKDLLGEDAEAFLQSYHLPRTQGLRMNPLKISHESPISQQLIREFNLEPVPWCPTGYYYDESSRPGKHPYHTAGLYYIQEPSAMSAVAILDPAPGEAVLDLAGAPGGKSTQIAGCMQGQGLLIANEIHPARAKILSENIERMGIANAVVTSAAPDKLAQRFPAFFDKIMLDAPCSGEGMFRKDPDAIAEWSPDHVRMCAARQMDILPDAVAMLKYGGLLAYSTCTFNREENESTIEELLHRYPEMELLKTERIWPHKQRGEGHFVALLRKNLSDLQEESNLEKTNTKGIARGRGNQNKPAKTNKHAADALLQFENFCKVVIPDYSRGCVEPLLFGDQLYLLPSTETFGSGQLDGLKVLRPGLHVGELKKNRFEPSHALALALTARELHTARTYRIAADSQETEAYLRGEALFTDRTENGWVIVTIDGFPLGWGKESEGQIKNHYPKGLRRTF